MREPTATPEITHTSKHDLRYTPGRHRAKNPRESMLKMLRTTHANQFSLTNVTTRRRSISLRLRESVGNTRAMTQPATMSQCANSGRSCVRRGNLLPTQQNLPEYWQTIIVPTKSQCNITGTYSTSRLSNAINNQNNGSWELRDFSSRS